MNSSEQEALDQRMLACKTKKEYDDLAEQLYQEIQLEKLEREAQYFMNCEEQLWHLEPAIFYVRLKLQAVCPNNTENNEKIEETIKWAKYHNKTGFEI